VSTLFDSELDSEKDRVDAALPEPPSEDVVRKLVSFGFSEKIVRGWTAGRANTALLRARHEWRALRERAGWKKSPDDPPEPGPIRQPSAIERAGCASVIENALGVHDLAGAVACGLYYLTDPELKEFAKLIVMQLHIEVPRVESTDPEPELPE